MLMHIVRACRISLLRFLLRLWILSESINAFVLITLIAIGFVFHRIIPDEKRLHKHKNTNRTVQRVCAIKGITGLGRILIDSD